MRIAGPQDRAAGPPRAKIVVHIGVVPHRNPAPAELVERLQVLHVSARLVADDIAERPIFTQPFAADADIMQPQYAAGKTLRRLLKSGQIVPLPEGAAGEQRAVAGQDHQRAGHRSR